MSISLYPLQMKMSGKTDSMAKNGTPGECRFLILSVYMLNLPYHLDKPYDYKALQDTDVREGDFVAVPFGGGNRPETALVIKKSTPNNVDFSAYKPIHAVLDRAYSLNHEALALTEFLKDYTFCTTGDAVRAITPTSAFSKFEELLVCEKKLPALFDESTVEFKIYSYVENVKNCTKSKLLSHFGAKVSQKLNKLISDGILSVKLEIKDSSNIKYNTYYSLNLTDEELTTLLQTNTLRSEKHKQILNFLAQQGQTEQSVIIKSTAASSAQIKSLENKNLIVCEKTECYRMPYIMKKAPQKIQLSQAQQEAADKIIALTKENKPKAALLHGITGSGKTQVIREIIDSVISDKKSVIVLVPEISLTPQTVSVFSSFYGERTAVIHSGLSAGERFDTWRKIKNKEIDVCIGTRSAIFAPLDNLGLIVIDEEQEHTYKSDSSPKYHARDVASFRCGKNNAVMLLVSATPSLESYHKTETGNYTLVTLSERFGNAKLPEAEILDMRNEPISGNLSLFSTKLANEISQNLKDNLQSVLFLNRRGYHSFLCCPSCGNAVMCPHCSVSLTHHFSRLNSDGFLSCHYCGFRSDIPKNCPSCQKDKMRFMGFGTQMAEDELKKIFPDADICRMDADTTSAKFSYDKILNDFKDKKTDILLGTQMVTKGHDFPGVTLVGMLSADQSLYVDDYRANERTFSMICQTVGRSGRGDFPGKAFIQCYNPSHYVLEMARRQDYLSFYKSEIKIRQNFIFPPFCDLAAFTVTSDSEKIAFSAATKICEFLSAMLSEQYKQVKMQVFGPFEAPVYKLNEKYRTRIVVKFKNSKTTRCLFKETMVYFGKSMPKNLGITIDINPNSI